MGGYSPKTSRAQQRPKLREIKASSSKQGHVESEEVPQAAPLCRVIVIKLAMPVRLIK